MAPFAACPEVYLSHSPIIEVLARAGSLSVAYAAYWAALATRPRSRIVLRQRALELVARDPSR